MPFSLTYKDSGVDIEAGYETVERIKKLVARTRIPGVLGDIGAFGGFFAPDLSGYQNPVLVSGTDGVGTKIKLAIELNIHHTIGIDCVAMCVNDIVCCGAKPLFFLDYFACHKLKPSQAERVLAGIAEGCQQAGCALVGGETAEMNDLYREGDYDLAGFVVGIAERDQLITGKQIQAGNNLWALPSSGLHSNGFSLVRTIVKQAEWNLQDIGHLLLVPTRIYVREVLDLTKQVKVHGLAHITGGGLPEKVGRIIPDGLQAVFHSKHWDTPDIFQRLQLAGHIAREEMFKTFNMGLGMVAVLPQGVQAPQQAGAEWLRVGQIESSSDGSKVKIL